MVSSASTATSSVSVSSAPKPSSMKSVSANEWRPLIPESARARASDTRNRSPPERASGRSAFLPHLAIDHIQRQIAFAALRQAIARAKHLQVAIRELDEMFESDALREDPEPVTGTRADSLINFSPCIKFLFLVVKLLLELLRAGALTIIIFKLLTCRTELLCRLQQIVFRFLHLML
jgi:hypothetical protein